MRLDRMMTPLHRCAPTARWRADCAVNATVMLWTLLGLVVLSCATCDATRGPHVSMCCGRGADNEDAMLVTSRHPASGSSRPVPDWTRKARRLIEYVEERHAEWNRARGVGTAAATRNAEYAEEAVCWGLMMLHRTTGRCEFVDVAEEELVLRAPLLSERYRAFLATHGQQALEGRMREAVPENIALLRTELWWPALTVLDRYIETVGLTIQITDMDDRCRWLVDEKTNTHIHDAVAAWWAREHARVVWNPARERFVFVDPFRFYDDDELRVADMAGTLTEFEDPGAPMIDWKAVHAGTVRLPRGCLAR